MNPIFIATVSLIVLVISFFLFRKAAGSLSFFSPNMISYVFYYNLVLQTFIASILVVFELDDHYVISRASDESRLMGWLAVSYAMVSMPVGLLLAKCVFSRKRSMASLLQVYVKQRTEFTASTERPLKYSLYFFTVLSISACIYTFVAIGYFPPFEAITADPASLSSTRISSSRDFRGSYYIRNIPALMITPIMAYAWYFYARQSKSTSDRMVFVVTFLSACSILYYDFSKSPVLMFLLGFIFARFYLEGRLRMIPVVTIVFFSLALLVTFYVLSGSSLTGLLSYNTGPIGRLILTQSAGMYLIFDIFPEGIPFLGFSSSSRLLSSIFQVDYVDRAARYAMFEFSPETVSNGTSDVMNTIFIGEAWANFGRVGLIFSPIWVGFLLQSLYILFLKVRKTPFYLALFVHFSITSGVTGGFNNYYYNPSVLILGAVVALILSLAWIVRNSRKIHYQ